MILIQKLNKFFNFLVKNERISDCNLGSLRNRRLEKMGGSYPVLNYDYEKEALLDILKVENYTMCSYERLLSLWAQVRFLDNLSIQGDLVECGTWKGGCCGIMALAHLKTGNPYRKIHLFDSFQGLPEPSESMDGQKAIDYAMGKGSGKCEPIGKCVATLEDNKELLQKIIRYPEDLLSYHVGWFQNTLPIAKENVNSIALLRLDGDWYESTNICLECLFDKIVPGGFLVIDDYGHWDGCRKSVDEFLVNHKINRYLHYIDSTGRYLQI